MRTTDVALPERLDVTTVASAREALSLAIDATPGRTVVVDASALESIDFAGLAVLVSAHRRSTALGIRLVFADPQPAIMRLFAVTRLHRVLHLERPAQAVS
jgi:anti-anti-sigma factor